LVYDSELQILLEWLNPTPTPKKQGKKEKNAKTAITKTDIPKHILTQVLVDVLKRPDVPPFTLTPAQICAGIFPRNICFVIYYTK
jgi:hypothetical protein